MKRSEMIKLMAEFMWNPPEEVRNMHDGGQQSVIMLNLLLNKMEEAGMMPPLIDGSAPLEFSDFCWEPEDEN